MNLTLKDVLTRPPLREQLRALLSQPEEGVSQLLIPGALYYTYSLHGDEVVVQENDVTAIEKAISAELGKPVVADWRVKDPRYAGQVFLQLPAAIRQELLLAVIDHLGEFPG